MDDRIPRIVAELPGLKSFEGVWALAGERVAQGDAAFVADLGIALARRYGTRGRAWQFSGVLDRLLRLLAGTAGAENAAQALRLVATAEVTSRELDRSTASLLASGQEPADLAAAFTGRASEELRACLVHELVLRGVAVAELPRISAWATSPHWRHHPLGWLPLTASAMEARADLPSYGPVVSSHAMPFGVLEGHRAAVVAGARVPSAREATTPAADAAMATAVAGWLEESNGRVEARVFDFGEPLAAEAVPNALLALGLDCLGGVGRSWSVDAGPPALAWRVLFAAASTGGAYFRGVHGAYGRLAAWRSMAALAGCPEGATAVEVEARVRDCTWYGFDAGTTWFEQVAWDFGLAALAPDRRRLAVLAATDTD
ncbi:DUF6183 family protein [Kitasatospora sp. NPDC004799]|uniref:DUF6183 family protein n=1 Tax=Kitasatospora sp. NPDC004799 TaxID=3154460 RepID=UPI0033A9B98F